MKYINIHIVRFVLLILNSIKETKIDIILNCYKLTDMIRCLFVIILT